MSGQANLPSLATRTKVLIANSLTFHAAFVLATDSWLPTGGLESVWLLSGVALWFLTLLSAPWFLPPRDGIVSAVGAGVILVTVDLGSVNLFQQQLDTLRWVSVAYCASIAILSLAALLQHDRNPKSPGSRLTFRLNGIFGRGELLFTPPALISIVGGYQDSFISMAWLLVLWTLFVVAQPVLRIASATGLWRIESTTGTPGNAVGMIDRVDHPNLVRVKLASSTSWKPSCLHIAAMPHGEQRYVLALFVQVMGEEVIGTGLCVSSVEEPLDLNAGEVCSAENSAKTVELVANLSGAPDSRLIGFVVENSTIASLRFEVAATRTLQEGDLVFAHSNGRDIFYQIVDAETAEESFDRNPRGTHIVRASQLGKTALRSILGSRR